MARYTVKQGKLDDAKRAIATFVDAVKRDEPRVLVYESFQERDSRAFAHIMTFADSAAQERHRTAEHTLAFVEAVYPMCEREPAFTPVALVRSNRGR